MKAFAHVDARDPRHAVALAQQARGDGKAASYAGGGSDLLVLMKERLVEPDVLVNLRSMPGLDRIEEEPGGLRIGGLVTLDALSRHPLVRERYTVLAEAAASVATPQIRNAATLAGNLCQRPWCWYYRGGFACFKNGGDTCYSLAGENQHHAMFGGFPCYMVHPSDTAPALVALGASLRLLGPDGDRELPAAEFFTLPEAAPSRENVLAPDELVLEIVVPAPPPGARSTYFKLLDREAWTHAVVAVALLLEMDGDTCLEAQIVLGGVAPIPWRLPDVEALLARQRLTPELAEAAGRQTVAGAEPLEKNAYKVALTRAAVPRTLLGLLQRT